MKSHITVFIPGLLSPMMNEAPDHKLPALEKLLSRATQCSGPKSINEGLTTLFHGLQQPIPSAALSALGQGIIKTDDSHYWCIASAASSLVTHQTAYIIGNTHLDLRNDEKESLMAPLNELLHQDGLNLIPSEGPQWICQIQKHTDIMMPDLNEVINKNLHPLLPLGPEQSFWHRLLTEVQMLLQSSKVNNQRAQENKPLVSTIWFWGIGKLPQKISTVFDEIYSNDKETTGLAILSDIECKRWSKLDDISLKSKYILIADNFLYNHAHHLQDDTWQKALFQLEENLFSPLLRACQNGDVSSVSLIFADGRCFDVTNAKLKYFWRKIQPLSLFLNINKIRNDN